MSSNFAELKLPLDGNEVKIWVGCEPVGADDPMPKLTFYLPQEH
jgi:hypothetical protein